MTSERLFCLGCQIDFLVGDPLEARCPGCGRHYSAYSGPLVRERSLALALWREQNPHAAFSSPPRAETSAFRPRRKRALVVECYRTLGKL